jgi:FKBP-type peptidyl-prolyl cis-trans isomerase
MKHYFYLLLAVLLTLFTAGSCKSDNSAGSSLGEENFDRDASYALGMDIGASMARSGIAPNLDEVLEGMKDSLSGGKTRFSEEEAGMKIQAAFNSMMEKIYSEAIQKEADFLVENGKKPGVHITATGLQYEVIEEGTGARPTAFDTVKVNYEGKLTDGTVFDSSYMWGEPAEFPLDRVIPGWTEGIQLMSVGSKYRLCIPSELAYGSQGGGPIPPYSALIFEVELLDIIK